MSDDPMTNPGGSGEPEGEGPQSSMPPIGQQNPPGLADAAPAPQEPLPPVPYAQQAAGTQASPYGAPPAQATPPPYLQQPPMPQQGGVPPQGPPAFQPVPPVQQPGMPQQADMPQQAAPQQPPVPPMPNTPYGQPAQAPQAGATAQQPAVPPHVRASAPPAGGPPYVHQQGYPQPGFQGSQPPTQPFGQQMPGAPLPPGGAVPPAPMMPPADGTGGALGKKGVAGYIVIALLLILMLAFGLKGCADVKQSVEAPIDVPIIDPEPAPDPGPSQDGDSREKLMTGQFPAGYEFNLFEEMRLGPWRIQYQGVTPNAMGVVESSLESGMTCALVRVQVAYEGEVAEGEDYYDALDITYVLKDGTEIEFWQSRNLAPHDLLAFENYVLKPGEARSGEFIFDVPLDSVPDKVRFTLVGGESKEFPLPTSLD